jgi:glycine betaine/proline transport system permease protein
VLDFMQTMPSFVYLVPLTLFFLIGPASATIATTIYAAPPVIRLTTHGIREVSAASLEASRALGATRWQILRTVQLPLAKRTIVIGVNQTTMAALSMVMIAALIDAPGIGPTVLHALSALDIGTAFVGGLAIVIMAVVLDRVTTAASVRVEARYRSGVHGSRRWLLIAGGGLTAACVYLAYTYYWAASFPVEENASPVGDAIAGAVNAVSDWVGLHLSVATTAFSDVISYGLINPLQALIADSPWYLICAVVLALTGTLAGVRALPVAAACLGLLLATGLWAEIVALLRGPVAGFTTPL